MRRQILLVVAALSSAVWGCDGGSSSTPPATGGNAGADSGASAADGSGAWDAATPDLDVVTPSGDVAVPMDGDVAPTPATYVPPEGTDCRDLNECSNDCFDVAPVEPACLEACRAAAHSAALALFDAMQDCIEAKSLPACVDDYDACYAACIPELRRCQGLELQRCDPQSMSFVAMEMCDAETQTCDATVGACMNKEPVCEPGEVTCSNTHTSVGVCAENQLSFEFTGCGNEICVNGACTDVPKSYMNGSIQFETDYALGVSPGAKTKQSAFFLDVQGPAIHNATAAAYFPSMGVSVDLSSCKGSYDEKEGLAFATCYGSFQGQELMGSFEGVTLDATGCYRGQIRLTGDTCQFWGTFDACP